VEERETDPVHDVAKRGGYQAGVNLGSWREIVRLQGRGQSVGRVGMQVANVRDRTLESSVAETKDDDRKVARKKA